MITIEQLKAARALLGWTQKELAVKSQVALASVANLEQGKGKAGGRVSQAIVAACETAGIEFTPEPGVRLCREKFHFRIFEGRSAIFELWDDIIIALGRGGGEVLMSGISEKFWIENYRDELIANILRQRALGISSRLLIEEGDNLVIIGEASYRAVPSYLFQQTPSFVYADRFAILNWGPPLRVLLIQNAVIAETYRRQFEANYEMGRKLDPRKVAVARLEGLPYMPGYKPKT